MKTSEIRSIAERIVASLPAGYDGRDLFIAPTPTNGETGIYHRFGGPVHYATIQLPRDRPETAFRECERIVQFARTIVRK